MEQNNSVAAMGAALRLHPLASSVALALALGGGHAPARAGEDAGTVETIVVSATRTPQLLKDAAAPVSKIDAGAFAERQARGIGDALQDLPNVDFGGGPRGAGRQPTLRGYSGKEVTLLVDGARMNSASGLGAPIFIDPWLLSGAEVLRGASSALYGSGGLGGVLALNTVAARDLLAPGRNWGADARLGRDLGEAGRSQQARAYTRQGGFDALLALGRRDWGAIREGGGGELAPNDGHAGQGLLKLGYTLRPDLRLTLSHRAYQESALRPNNPQSDASLGQLGAVPVQRNLIDQSQTTIGIEHTEAGGAPTLSAQLYRTRLDTSAEANPAQSLAASSSFTRTVGGGVQRTTRWGRHRLSYGIDGYRDEQDARNGGQPNPVTPPGRQTVAGVFVQDEWRLGDAWLLTPAARYDRYSTHVDGGAGPDARQGHLSPKLTAALRFTPQWQAWASAGESYRAPSLSETYMNLSCTGCLFNFAPNPALRPETDRTLELGANYDGRGWFAAGDRVQMKGSVFYSTVDDLIATAVVGAYQRSFPFKGRGLVFQSQNKSNARRQGVELEWGWRNGAWRADLAYSRLRVRDADTDQNLFAPPDKLVANLGWKWQAWRLNWRSRLVAAQSRDSTLERRTAGYASHDLFVNWRPDAAPQLELSAGISNLGDHRYIVYQSENPTSRVVEMGRALQATLGWTF
ncbi:TonB-dependent receptor domain-containing protein [Rugamonas rubra]|uniref:Methanobactin biosynthesis cassette protein MbnT n=1 Tax=Rugamonas rubra TaxID=758825 RepID=A0A1I4IFV4_9BURK|nr:TonB-dependent receptor [Rugamonas rubra]SFL53154.1 Methanobactin biosynthesis cassette protein MbnT [Rugamonas rubra]